MKIRGLVLLLILGCVIAGVIVAFLYRQPSGPLQLDSTFNGTGRLTTSFEYGDDLGMCLALQADGKIIGAAFVSGSSRKIEFGLARFLSDGRLDDSFGNDGKITQDFGSDLNSIKDIIIQPDGKIVVAGYTGFGIDSDFAVARFLPDGRLDPSFSSDGKVLTNVGGKEDEAYAAALQTDGKIIVAGSSSNGETKWISIVRYLPDGSLDPTFGGDGTVAAQLTNGVDTAQAVLALPDGTIVIAGNSGPDIALVRYLPNGELDPSFNHSGTVVTSVGPFTDEANCAALQRDGKILVAGFTFKNFHELQDFVVLRYNTDGSLDPTFNGTGVATTSMCDTTEMAQSILVQPNGLILIAGYAGIQENMAKDFAVARYLSDGALDRTFNGSGKGLVPSNSWNNEKVSMQLQSDGKIILFGTTRFGSFDDSLLVRLEPQ